MKALVVFDLDGTLAESKGVVSTDMVSHLTELMRHVKVAVISGGGWPQFQTQLLGQLPEGPWLDRLFLLPTCGAEFFRYEQGWQVVYSHAFSPAERDAIISALNQALEVCAFDIPVIWGPQIEDRGGQITLSALGQRAPLSEKQAWDPDMRKRRQLLEVLAPLLPEASARMGGATSIDVTRPGIDKAYGLRQLGQRLDVALASMIFIGDALYPGGNDFPAISTGVTTIAVRGPDETRLVIEAICATLA